MSDTPPPAHIVIDARSRPSSTGRYIDRLIEHLQQIDTTNRYTILLRPGDTVKLRNPNFQTKPCAYKQFSFNLLDQLGYALFLYRLRPDLVHFGMTPQEPMFYFGKRVTTTHDLTMLRFTRAGKLPSWLHALRMAGYRLLFWWSLRRAWHIIVPTRFVADDVAMKYPFTKPKTTITYEASEPALAGKAMHPKAVTRPFIMHLGSPFPHKNIERLVDAFALLRKTHPDLQLVLVGKKEQYFEKLEQSVKKRHDVRDAIVFTGFVSDAELKWLYENAEAYALPSLSEGFGLPGLEAMVHGCPVASSSATCLPEVYDDAAHYFDPENIEDMAAKIQDVLTDTKLRKKLIKKGYIQIKKYSWSRMAQETHGVYQTLLR